MKTVSRRIANKMKKLGATPKSEFYYLKNDVRIPAYTADEVADMLPNCFSAGTLNENDRYVRYLTIRKLKLWHTKYGRNPMIEDLDDKNLADNLAKMWCYLKENGLL